MSEWYEPTIDDIDLDDKQNQVDIFVKQNDFGNVYVSLSYEQIAMLHKVIFEKPKREVKH